MTSRHQATGTLVDGSGYVATMQSLEVTGANGQPLASFSAAEFRSIERDGVRVTIHRHSDRPVILTTSNEAEARALESVFRDKSSGPVRPVDTQLAADTSHIIFDSKDQMQMILPWILPFERLLAVFDCKGAGTGFVAITNKRLLFYDKAFMAKRKALTSVPFNKIASISSIDNRGMMQMNWTATSELVVKAGADTYEFDFRGGDKAHTAYQLIMRELLQNEPD